MAIQEEEDHTGSSVEDSVHEVYQETGGPASKEDVSNVANLKEDVFVDKVSDVEGDKTLEKGVEEAKVEGKGEDVVATRGTSEVTDSKTEEVSSEPVEAVETSRDVPATEEVSKVIEASDGGAPVSDVSHEGQVDERSSEPVDELAGVPVTSADENTSEEPVKEDSEVAEQTPADEQVEDVSKDAPATEEEVTLMEEGGEPKAVVESSPETVESSGEVEGDEPKSVSATEESSREVPVAVEESDTAEEFKDEAGEAKGDEAIDLETVESSGKDAEPEIQGEAEQDVDVDDKGGEVIESTVEILPETEEKSSGDVEEPKAEPSEDEVKGDEVIESVVVTVPETEEESSTTTTAAESKVEEDLKPSSEPDVAESTVVTSPEAEEESSKEVAAEEDSNVEEAVAESSPETVETSGEAEPIATDAGSRDINVHVEEDEPENDLAADGSSSEPVAVEASDTATTEGKVEAEEFKDEVGDAKGDEPDSQGKVDDFEDVDQDVDLPETEEPAGFEEPQVEPSKQNVDEEVIESTVVTAPEAEEEKEPLKPSEQDVDEAVEANVDSVPEAEDGSSTEPAGVEEPTVDDAKVDQPIEVSVPEAAENLEEDKVVAVEEPESAAREVEPVAVEEPDASTAEFEGHIEDKVDGVPGDKPVETSIESVPKIKDETTEELDAVEEPVEGKVDDSKDESGEVKSDKGLKADSELLAALEGSEDQADDSESAVETGESLDESVPAEQVEEPLKEVDEEEPVESTVESNSEVVLDGEEVKVGELGEAVPETEKSSGEPVALAVPESKAEEAEDDVEKAKGDEPVHAVPEDSKDPVELLTIEAKDEEPVEASEDSIPETGESSKDDVDLVATEREVKDPVAEPDVQVDEPEEILDSVDAEEPFAASVKDDTTVQVTASDGVAEEALEKEASVESGEHEEVKEPSEQTVEEGLAASEPSQDVEVLETSVDLGPDTVKPDVEDPIELDEPVETTVDEPSEEESTVDEVPDTVKPNEQVDTSVDVQDTVETNIGDTVKPGEEETSVDVIPETINTIELVETSVDVVPDTVKPGESVEARVEAVLDAVKPSEPVETGVDVALDTVKPVESEEVLVEAEGHETNTSAEPTSEDKLEPEHETLEPEQEKSVEADEQQAETPVPTEDVLEEVTPNEETAPSAPVEVDTDAVERSVEVDVDSVLEVENKTLSASPQDASNVEQHTDGDVETRDVAVQSANEELVEPSTTTAELGNEVAAKDGTAEEGDQAEVDGNVIEDGKAVQDEEVTEQLAETPSVVEEDIGRETAGDEQVEGVDKVAKDEEEGATVPEQTVETEDVEQVDMPTTIPTAPEEAETSLSPPSDELEDENKTKVDKGLVEHEPTEAEEEVVTPDGTQTETGADQVEETNRSLEIPVVPALDNDTETTSAEEASQPQHADVEMIQPGSDGVTDIQQGEIKEEATLEEPEAATEPETETADEPVDMIPTSTAAPEAEVLIPSDELMEAVTPREETQPETGVLQVKETDRSLPEVLFPEAHVNNEAHATEPPEHSDIPQGEFIAEASLDEPETVVEESSNASELIEETVEPKAAEVKESTPLGSIEVLATTPATGLEAQDNEAETIEEASVFQHADAKSVQVDELVDVSQTGTKVDALGASDELEADKETKTGSDQDEQIEAGQVEETDRFLEVQPVDVAGTESSQHADIETAQSTESQVEVSLKEQDSKVSEEAAAPSPAADQLVGETVEEVRDSTPVESIEVLSTTAPVSEGQDEVEPIKETSPIQHADVESVQPSVGAGVEDGKVKNESVLEDTEKAEDDHFASTESQHVAEDVEQAEGGKSLPHAIELPEEAIGTEELAVKDKAEGDQHVEAPGAPASEDQEITTGDSEETADETLAAPTDIPAVQDIESLPKSSSASKEVQIPETEEDAKVKDMVADAEEFQSIAELPALESQKENAAEPAGEEASQADIQDGAVKDIATATSEEDQQGGEELVSAPPLHDSVKVENVDETTLTTKVENVDQTSLTTEARKVEDTTVEKDTAPNEPSFEGASAEESSRSVEPPLLDVSDIVKATEPTLVEVQTEEATYAAGDVSANKLEAAQVTNETEVKPEGVVSQIPIEQGAEVSLAETKQQVFPVNFEAEDGEAGKELMSIEIAQTNDAKENENVVEELVQEHEPKTKQVLPVETEVTEKEEVKNKDSEDDEQDEDEVSEEASSKPGNIITSTLKGIVAAAVSLTRGTGAKPSKKKRLRLKKELAAMQVAS